MCVFLVRALNLIIDRFMPADQGQLETHCLMMLHAMLMDPQRSRYLSNGSYYRKYKAILEDQIQQRFYEHQK